jgi:hypothetical protein
MQPFKHLVGKIKVKMRDERITDRCKDTIKIYLKEVGCENGLCIHLAEEKDQWCTPPKTKIILPFL